jgi:hypothetical protein
MHHDMDNSGHLKDNKKTLGDFFNKLTKHQLAKMKASYIRITASRRIDENLVVDGDR